MLNPCHLFADWQSKDLVPYLLILLMEFNVFLFLSVWGVQGGLSLNDASLYPSEFLYIHCVSSISSIIFSDTQIVLSLAVRSHFIQAPVFTFVRALLLFAFWHKLFQTHFLYFLPRTLESVISPRNVGSFSGVWI